MTSEENRAKYKRYLTGLLVLIGIVSVIMLILYYKTDIFKSETSKPVEAAAVKTTDKSSKTSGKATRTVVAEKASEDNQPPEATKDESAENVDSQNTTATTQPSDKIAPAPAKKSQRQNQVATSTQTATQKAISTPEREDFLSNIRNEEVRNVVKSMIRLYQETFSCHNNFTDLRTLGKACLIPTKFYHGGIYYELSDIKTDFAKVIKIDKSSVFTICKWNAEQIKEFEENIKKITGQIQVFFKLLNKISEFISANRDSIKGEELPVVLNIQNKMYYTTEPEPEDDNLTEEKRKFELEKQANRYVFSLFFSYCVPNDQLNAFITSFFRIYDIRHFSVPKDEQPFNAGVNAKSTQLLPDEFVSVQTTRTYLIDDILTLFETEKLREVLENFKKNLETEIDNTFNKETIINGSYVDLNAFKAKYFAEFVAKCREADEGNLFNGNNPDDPKAKCLLDAAFAYIIQYRLMETKIITSLTNNNDKMTTGIEFAE